MDGPGKSWETGWEFCTNPGVRVVREEQGVKWSKTTRGGVQCHEGIPPSPQWVGSGEWAVRVPSVEIFF